MTKLIIYEEIPGEEPTFEDFELITNRILIGSSPDNQLVLESPDIDPTHASLELRFDTWVLQDLGAPGGTAVNGQEITGPYLLKDKDLIELGHLRLRFRDPLGLDFETEPEEAALELPPDDSPPPVKGRVWFAGVTGVTLVVIFTILLLLIIAHYFGLLNIVDLMPGRG